MVWDPQAKPVYFTKKSKPPATSRFELRALPNVYEFPGASTYPTSRFVFMTGSLYNSRSTVPFSRLASVHAWRWTNTQPKAQLLIHRKLSLRNISPPRAALSCHPKGKVFGREMSCFKGFYSALLALRTQPPDFGQGHNRPLWNKGQRHFSSFLALFFHFSFCYFYVFFPFCLPWASWISRCSAKNRPYPCKAFVGLLGLLQQIAFFRQTPEANPHFPASKWTKIWRKKK